MRVRISPCAWRRANPSRASRRSSCLLSPSGRGRVGRPQFCGCSQGDASRPTAATNPAWSIYKSSIASCSPEMHKRGKCYAKIDPVLRGASFSQLLFTHPFFVFSGSTKIKFSFTPLKKPSLICKPLKRLTGTCPFGSARLQGSPVFRSSPPGYEPFVAVEFGRRVAYLGCRRCLPSIKYSHIFGCLAAAPPDSRNSRPARTHKRLPRCRGVASKATVIRRVPPPQEGAP